MRFYIASSKSPGLYCHLNMPLIVASWISGLCCIDSDVSKDHGCELSRGICVCRRNVVDKWIIEHGPYLLVIFRCSV